MKRGRKLITLFFTMAKIGLFTFGGGWSIIAQVQNEFVDRRGWLSEEQLVDYMSLAKSFPGIMIINMSVFCGYSMCGIPGAVAAAVGLSTPAIITIAIVTYFYSALRDNIWVVKILNGVRSVVIPIILSAAWKLKQTALKGHSAYILLLISFFVCAFTGVSKILVMITALIAGLLIWRGEIPDHDVH